AGLGLGYALAGRDRIPLVATVPLLAWQMLLLTLLRHGLAGPVVDTNGYSWRVQSLLATPFPEQRNIGFAVAQSGGQFVAAYAFLSVLFILSALAFLPVGQLCGRLMSRRPQLRAYALNLLGSLLGVVLLLVASALWTPPLVWFAPLLALLLAFQAFDRRVLLAGALASLSGAAALRAGAVRVEAIELDPVILRLGRLYHPERPYDDARVRAIVNDARTYLRTTPETYDLIVYGLLDSHTLLSHASSVRLESFVYTVEGIREARARLADDGLLSLAFA